MRQRQIEVCSRQAFQAPRAQTRHAFSDVVEHEFDCGWHAQPSR